MLLILLFWGWALSTSLGLGLGLSAALRRLGPLPSILISSPELLCLTGLAALAWLVAVLSFGLPVALPMQVGLSGLAGGCLVLNRAQLWALLSGYTHEWRAAGVGAGALAAVLAALVLVHAAQPPAFPDAALYHAQFVQWLHQFPVVPGLGNLQSRLAFNSHAHLLTAFFSPAAAGRGPAFQQIVNSLGCLLLGLHHVRRAAAHARPGGQPWLSWFYGGTLLLLLMALRPWISSPLPDSTVAVWGLLLLGVLLETPRLALGGLAWLALLAATALTFKPSGGLLLLWPVALLLRLPRRAWGRGLAVVAGAAALVLLPWLGRNVLQSGYLAYPLAGWSMGLDWAVPEPQRLADMAEIRLFARRPLSDWPEAAGQRLPQWLPTWWAQQEPADQRLLLLVLAGAVLVLAWRRPAALRRQLGRVEVQLYGLLLLGCGAWFVAAPALRFGYAYLIGAAALGPLLVLRAPLARWRRPGGGVLLSLGLLYGANGLRHELARPGALTTYAVWPADYPRVVGRVAGRLGPYPLRVAPAATGRCGNCPLPCAEAWPPGLRLRGTTLGQGFSTQPGQGAVLLLPVVAEP